MTEQEAKTKWCPMVRHVKDQEGNFYTTNGCNSSGFETCIASDCMMWRWQYQEEKREGHDGGKELLLKRGVQVGYDVYKLEATGYCGLGGKP